MYTTRRKQNSKKIYYLNEIKINNFSIKFGLLSMLIIPKSFNELHN